jgi:ribonuclease VapC
VIIDSSAIIAIVRNEPEQQLLLSAMASAAKMAISTATLLEARVVAQRSGVQGLEDDVVNIIKDRSVEIAPFTDLQQQIAADAHRTFGRGSGHPAKLNFGDCFAYALAKDREEPLLFKGNDFAKTDIDAAL